MTENQDNAVRQLQDKVAIVTGGASGIGEAIVRRFIAAGCRVVIADMQEEKGRDLAEALGATVHFARLDVADEGRWADVVSETVDRFGGIDILVNGAGRMGFSSLLDTSLDDFNNHLRVNLAGTFLGIKTVGRLLVGRGGGSIVNISSIEGMRGISDMGAYVASKWGVRGLTKVAALELGRLGVRVNSVHPGPVNTPMSNPLGLPKEEMNQLMGAVPLHRMGEPMEIAEAVLFLASDAASFVNGAELAVDGGNMAGVYITYPDAPST